LDEDGNPIMKSALDVVPEGEEGDEGRESPEKEQPEGDSDLERAEGAGDGEEP
jgi:hypothetical protein